MITPEHFYVGGMAHEPEPLHYRECGLDNIFLLNGFRRETIDGEECVTIEDLDGLWKAIGFHLVLERKTLDPKEVKYLRRSMDFTQAEIAELLRVGDQTVARWEKGDVLLPGPADLALRMLFLCSPAAAPEGKKAMRGILDHLKRLSATDDHPTKDLRFSHKKSAWKEAA